MYHYISRKHRIGVLYQKALITPIKPSKLNICFVIPNMNNVIYIYVYNVDNKICHQLYILIKLSIHTRANTGFQLGVEIIFQPSPLPPLKILFKGE